MDKYYVSLRKKLVRHIKILNSLEIFLIGNLSIFSEFLRHHLVPGTLYRMRLAARTEGGIGEFSAARTVNYRLPDDKESDDADEETGTEDPAVDLSSISDSRRSSEYSDESSRSVENNDPTSSTDS